MSKILKLLFTIILFIIIVIKSSCKDNNDSNKSNGKDEIEDNDKNKDEKKKKESKALKEKREKEQREKELGALTEKQRKEKEQKEKELAEKQQKEREKELELLKNNTEAERKKKLAALEEKQRKEREQEEKALAEKQRKEREQEEKALAEKQRKEREQIQVIDKQKREKIKQEIKELFEQLKNVLLLAEKNKIEELKEEFGNLQGNNVRIEELKKIKQKLNEINLKYQHYIEAQIQANNPKNKEPKKQKIKKNLKVGKYHQQNHPAATTVCITEDIPLGNIEYKITTATPNINFVRISYKGLNTQLNSNTKESINGVIKNIIIKKDQQRLEDENGPIRNSNIIIDLQKIDNITTTRLKIITDDKGQIKKLTRKKFGTENGVCTFSVAIFLKKLEQNNNPMNLDPDDIIKEALKKYLELTPDDFRESRATDIINTLEIIGLKVINKDPIPIQDKKSLQTEILKIKKRSIEQNKMIRMDMRNGPESWAIVCINGIFYLFDSHGKENIGDKMVSFIKKFDNINAFIDFCYEFSVIKHRIDLGEYVQLGDSIYNYEIN